MLTKLDKRYIYKYDEKAVKATLEQMLNDSKEAAHNMEHPYDLDGDEDVNKLKE